jgi:hypothetical protein
MKDAEHRHASDSITSDIESMIIGEQDPQQRAFLIVLNNINLALIANTKLAREVSEDNAALRGAFNEHVETFATHVQAVDAVKNKGRGAWQAGAALLVIVQALVTFIAYQSTDTLDRFKLATERALAKQSEDITSIRQSLGQLQGYRK